MSSSTHPASVSTRWGGSVLMGMLAMSLACGGSITPGTPLETIERLPQSLTVVHSPEPVKAMEGGRSGTPYTWLFTTTVSTEAEPVQIVEFGAFRHDGLSWVFRTYTGKPFTTAHFEDWYGCEGGWVRPGRPCVDDKNWQGGQELVKSSTRWYYVGVTEGGEQVAGWADSHFAAGLRD